MKLVDISVARVTSMPSSAHVCMFATRDWFSGFNCTLLDVVVVVGLEFAQCFEGFDIEVAFFHTLYTS